jgi:hypothetical protein
MIEKKVDRKALKGRKKELIDDMLNLQEVIDSYQQDYEDLQCELEQVCEQLGEDVNDIEELQ